MKMSNSYDLMGLIQVIIAGFSIIVDVILVFVAAKINSSANKNHVNQVLGQAADLGRAAETTSSTKQERMIGSKIAKDKIKEKITRLIRKTSKPTAVQFIKALKEVSSEMDIARRLYDCKDHGITWHGILSVDTSLEIDVHKIEDIINILSGESV